MEFSIMRGQLKAMLVLAATKDVRYYLNGLHVRQGQFGTIIEATDGHLLGMLRISTEPKPQAEVILERDSLKPLLGTKRQADELVEFYVSEGVVKAAAVGINLTMKAVDGVFPDTSRVTPKNGDLLIEPDAPSAIDPYLLVRFAEVSAALDGGKVWVRQRGQGTCLVNIEVPDFIGVVMAMRGYEQFNVPVWVHGAERQPVIEKTEQEVTA